MTSLPCGYVLSAPVQGSLVLCGLPVNVFHSGRALCSRHDPASSYIYIVQRGGHVKIGVTEHPRQRLGAVMRGVGCKIPAGMSGPAVLLALVRGDIRTERLFHAAFAQQRDEGEWFRIEGAVADWIATMNSAEYYLVETAVDAEHLLDDEAERQDHMTGAVAVNF